MRRPVAQGKDIPERTGGSIETERGVTEERTAATPDPNGVERVSRRAVGVSETRQAQRSWWDLHAGEYQAEHAGDLGSAAFLWCPEGLTEDAARLLGDIEGRTAVSYTHLTLPTICSV